MVGDPDFAQDQQVIDVGNTVLDLLPTVLDVHGNRFSRQRYRDIYVGTYPYLARLAEPFPERPTVVDIGCGSWNPRGISFLYLLLGAERAYALDLDAVENAPKAVRALAELAAIMILDPSSIVGEHQIEREEILRNLAGFDLAKLYGGDEAGIDKDRLVYALSPAEDMPIATGVLDLVMSNAFLEHVQNLGDVLAEFARVTRPGGVGVHVVDATDHRRYYDPTVHPLDYLKEEMSDDACTLSAPGGVTVPMNRRRPSELKALFQGAGFEVVGYEPFTTTEVNEELRSCFVEPYRSMALEDLRVLMARIVVRRR